MKRFYFIFLPVVLVFLYSIPGVFCLSGGGGIASSSFFEKKQKNKKKHPRSESNPGFQSAREMLARFSRDSFTRQVSRSNRGHGLHGRRK